tara:strand:+ start:1427 stop:2113 length:687 start_codon:yes stop_codon:yes gene_type:complete
MATSPPDGTHYVILKLDSAADNTLTTNVFPLKCASVGISTTKTIPSFNIPFAGLFTGEATTLAMNLGMASKTISLTGILLDQTIVRQFDLDDNPSGDFTNPALSSDKLTINMTAFEMAQLLHSTADSSAAQNMQNVAELTILMPSKVNSSYQYRNSGATSELVPFTFASRGAAGKLDNQGTLGFTSTFPDAMTDKGIEGFIRSFTSDHVGETLEVAFTLEFEVALPVI